LNFFRFVALFQREKDEIEYNEFIKNNQIDEWFSAVGKSTHYPKRFKKSITTSKDMIEFIKLV
jgi:hypothetical protein